MLPLWHALSYHVWGSASSGTDTDEQIFSTDHDMTAHAKVAATTQN
jgi:hypothetical protein